MGNAIRYELEQLLRLKDSPSCTKPKDLPPPEEYMGYVRSIGPRFGRLHFDANSNDSVPAETIRPQTKVTTDRHFGSLAQPKLETSARRPAVDRHGSRNGNGSMCTPTPVPV